MSQKKMCRDNIVQGKKHKYMKKSKANQWNGFYMIGTSVMKEIKTL